MHKKCPASRPHSGRSIIAQRFIAGEQRDFRREVRETDDRYRTGSGSDGSETQVEWQHPLATARGSISVVRFTDYVSITLQPSSKLLGYCHSSADADCLKCLFCAKPGRGLTHQAAQPHNQLIKGGRFLLTFRDKKSANSISEIEAVCKSSLDENVPGALPDFVPACTDHRHLALWCYCRRCCDR